MHPNVTAYLKDDIPVRWHLANHHRVPPITLVADLGWSMYSVSRGTPVERNNHENFNCQTLVIQVFIETL